MVLLAALTTRKVTKMLSTKTRKPIYFLRPKLIYHIKRKGKLHETTKRNRLRQNGIKYRVEVRPENVKRQNFEFGVNLETPPPTSIGSTFCGASSSATTASSASYRQLIQHLEWLCGWLRPDKTLFYLSLLYSYIPLVYTICIYLHTHTHTHTHTIYICLSILLLGKVEYPPPPRLVRACDGPWWRRQTASWLPRQEPAQTASRPDLGGKGGGDRIGNVILKPVIRWSILSAS